MPKATDRYERAYTARLKNSKPKLVRIAAGARSGEPPLKQPDGVRLKNKRKQLLKSPSARTSRQEPEAGAIQ